MLNKNFLAAKKHYILEQARAFDYAIDIPWNIKYSTALDFMKKYPNALNHTKRSIISHAEKNLQFRLYFSMHGVLFEKNPNVVDDVCNKILAVANVTKREFSLRDFYRARQHHNISY